MELIEKELTHAIKACFYRTQNEVGLGMPEEAYQQGLIKAFSEQALKFASKDPMWLPYRGKNTVLFEPDFIVADRVVIEIKALREGFAIEHYIQLFSYLKLTKLRVGFLVNFGREWVHDERFVYDEKPYALSENWDDVKGLVEGQDRDVLMTTRDALIELGQTYGLGYGELTYRRLMVAASEVRGLSVLNDPMLVLHFRDATLGEFKSDCLLIGNRVVCLVMALKDGLHDFDVGRVRSYLKSLRLKVGVVANFGKTQLELRGVLSDGLHTR